MEVEVCNADELQNGQMREVSVGEGKALLIKEKNTFYAIGAKCTHLGAPLAKGVLCNGHVRCPWHGACFNIKTGDIEDFPGLDSVAKYQVDVKNGKVRIKATEEELKNSKRTKTMVTTVKNPKKIFLILGGGVASVECAETLRQEGFDGRVLIATKEASIPYDRSKLSKVLSATVEELKLRPAPFYNEHGIELMFETEAVRVDASSKTVVFKNGESLSYTCLLVATGAVARTLQIPGASELSNIRTLRTITDANRILAEATGKEVVIIGSSFIGVETACYLVDKAKSVTLVGRDDAPFKASFGSTVGNAVKKLLEDKGVKFVLNTSPKEFKGAGGHLTSIILENDTEIAADLCIIGTGVMPATDFLEGSGIARNSSGFIEVDQHMKTSVAHVFAAGDVTTFPLFLANRQRANVQHWQMAHKQGHIAALNMLEKKAEIHSVPYFWTVVFGKSFRYTGYSGPGVGFDDVIIHGDVSEMKFAAYYLKGDKVVAVASVNSDPIASQAAEMFYGGKDILREDLKSESADWLKHL